MNFPWQQTVQKASPADLAEVQRLFGLQGQLNSKIRDAFLQAVQAMQDELDLQALAELLRQGRVSEALSAVSQATATAQYGLLAQAITDATIMAGQAAATAMRGDARLNSLAITFNVTNPNAIGHLQQYEMNLIREITASQMQAIQAAITAGVTEGRNPNDVARDVRGSIGLTQRQSQAVMNFRRMLEQGDREALTRALRDKRFDPSVLANIEGRKPLSQDQINKMVERYQDKYLQYRARTIARTESIRALNTGNHMTWSQNVSSGKLSEDQVTREWVYTHDDRTRDAHRHIPALNPGGVGLNEPFKSELGPILYPGDPTAAAGNTINCRCTVIYRFKYKKIAETKTLEGCGQ